MIGTFTTPIQDRPLDVQVSPDGRQIAAITNNGVMRLYDTRTYRPTGHFDAVNGPYAYVPGSGDLFVGDPRPGTADFWLVAPRTGRTVRTFAISKLWQMNPTSPAEPTLASRDGRYGFFLYALVNRDGSDGPAYMEQWRLDHSGRSHPVQLGGTGMIAAGALPGDRVIAALDGRIVTWDARTQKVIRSVSGPTFGPTEFVNGAISPDGRTFAYGLENGTVHFWDIGRGKSITGLGGHSAAVQRIAFSPDSSTAVSTGDDGVSIVWDPVSGQPIERLTGHTGRVIGADFSPDGKTLYTAGLDGAILAYDLSSGRRFGSPFKVPPGHPPSPAGNLPPAPLLAVSSNGRLFATGALPDNLTQSSVEIYSASTLGKLATISLQGNRNASAGAWAGNRFVLGADRGLVQLWDFPVGVRPRRVGALQGLSAKGQVLSVAVADGGGIVAVVDGWFVPQPNAPSTERGELAIWRDGRLVGRPMQLDNTFNAIALSADGATVATAVGTKTAPHILLVDTRTGRLERMISVQNASGSVTALAFAPDGALASGTWSGIVNLWNPKTGGGIGHPTLVVPAPVASISFSPNGKEFATSGGSSGGTKIWVTATQQQLGSDFPGGEGQWGSVAFTPDSRYLISVFGDGTAFRWPVSVKAWEQRACKVAGRNFTLEEWSRFVGGRGRSRVCS